MLVGALVAGATIAFYNDTETSQGNIFTAGSVDLKVDHLAQTYNNLDCETCSLTLYSSDGQNMVTDSSDSASYQSPLPTPAVLTWVHPNWADHSVAEWIWVEPTTSPNDATNEVEYTFERDFYWNGVVGDITFDLSLASDNGYAIYVNDTLIVDHLADEFNYNAVVQALSGYENAFKDALDLGNNTLKIIVRNHAPVGWQGTPTTNPAGLLYYLNIEREDCDQDLGFQKACRLWIEKDLGEGDTFFNFGDIKPSDWGTNLISLHVETNDAYACLFPNSIVDGENTRIEPEESAGDTTPDQPDGELSQFIKMFAWADDGNGVYEGESVLIPVNTPLSNIEGSMVAMNLQSGDPDYIGLAWCVGTQSLVGNDIECSGSASGIDQAQTDSVTAALTAYAVQQRNNDNFTCAQAYTELFPVEPILGQH